MAEQRGITPTMKRNLSPEERKKLYLSISPNLTGADFDAIMAEIKARQSRVPPVGNPAPDFELDMLDRRRKRTGETVRLSDLRGRPVGLMFGSYT
jgi:hypothetical protein